MSEFNTYEITRRLGHVGIPYPALGVLKGFRPVRTVVRTVKGALTFNNELGGEDIFTLTLNDWEFPDEPDVSITGGNKIIETPINRGERTANVLEEINLNNYKIRIQGTLYGEGDEYPHDLVRKLRSILEAPGSKEIKSTQLETWEIRRIAIKRWVMPAKQGTPNEQDYLIEGLSDTSILLDMKESENE